MSIRIIPIEEQGYGAFNGGEIVENKPIGFPQDHSTIRPYSNLFYWAHAKAQVDSAIGLHPHKGFEICSFVLKGHIRHFDTKMEAWRPLQAGDIQIIRAGNGISHSEWMGKDAEIFQIWFDPNLDKTLNQPASYDDYRAADFPEKTEGSTRIKTLVGAGSPLRMDTPGVEIWQVDLSNSTYRLPAEAEKIYSAYVLDGELSVNGEAAKLADFVQLTEQTVLEMKSDTGAQVFIIASPVALDYATYAQRMQQRTT
ncbi:MAG: pirin family protein [Saprospiraceae bacterium]